MARGRPRKQPTQQNSTLIDEENYGKENDRVLEDELSQSVNKTGNIIANGQRTKSQNQQTTGLLAKEMNKIQRGNRPVVILDGPRNSRLRSSLSGVESSPASSLPGKHHQMIKEGKEPKEPTKKDAKPFENLLSTTSKTLSVNSQSAIPGKSDFEGQSERHNVKKKILAPKNCFENDIAEQANDSITFPSSKNIQRAYDDLLEKFDQLCNLRTTTAEQFLFEYKQNSEARAQVATSLISSLREENAKLKAALEENTVQNARRESITSIMTSGSTTSNGAISIDRVLELYRVLTGLDISTQLEENHWKCRISGKKGCFNFELELVNFETGMFCYRPLFSPDDAICSRLPSYLTEEIEFGADHLQMFFWRAFNFLMSSNV